MSQVFPNNIITGWKLSKIISPRENVLTFSYSPSAVIQSAKQYSQTRQEMLCGQIDSFNLGIEHPQPTSILTGYGVYYLQSITSDNISIEFIGSDRLDIQRDGVESIYTTNISSNIGLANEINPRKLDNVVINNSLGEITHNYKMSYSYFNNDQITETKDTYLTNKIRLKLDQINFNGQNYRKFDYINPNKLPDKTTMIRDFWGFQSSIISPRDFYFPSYHDVNNWCGGTYQNITNIPGGDRSSDFEAAKNGLLCTVIYPTGGYTKLNYEPNNIKIDKDNVGKFENYNLIKPKKLASVEAVDSVSIQSDIFEIKNTQGTKLSLNIAYGLGGQYDIPAGFDYSSDNIKYTIEQKDKNRIAYQLINVDTGKGITTGYFTKSGIYGEEPLKPDPNNNTWNKHHEIIDVVKGRYRIKVTGLRHISNLFAENEGAHYGQADYMKIYKCHVRVEATLPILENTSTTNIEAGGIRIKSIENYNDKNVLLTKKEYNYILNTKNEDHESISSGILFDELAFYSVRNHLIHEKIINYNSSYNDIFSDKLIRELSSESSLRSPSSSPIGYSRVEEVFIDNRQEQNNSGKIISEFINRVNKYGYVGRDGNFNICFIFDRFAAQSARGQEYAKVPFMSYQDINGKIIKEEYYDKNNKLIRKTDYKYDYDYYNTQNISHPKAIATGMLQYQKTNYGGTDDRRPGAHSEFYLQPVNSFIYALQVYKIISEDISLLLREDTEYIGGVAISKKTTYEYNDHFQPKKITQNSSELAKDIVTEMLYPTDLATVEQTPLLQQLVKDNMISEPVSSKTKVSTTQVVNSHTKYREISINYKNEAQNLSKKLIVPDIKYERSSGEIVLGANDPTNRTIKYDAYDLGGRLVQVTALEQAPVVYLWGYGGQYIIAKIQNTTYAQINTALGSAIIEALSAAKQPDMSLVNRLRANTSLSEPLVTTYTYKPLVGILTATDPRGVVTYHTYDPFGRLKETYIIEDGVKKVIATNNYHYQNE